MILITGSTGLVGLSLLRKLDDKNIKYIAPARNELDIKNLQGLEVYLKKIKPKIVIHLAAETNVDLCEIQRTHAILVNYEATRVIANYCGKENARVIYISTSGILAGNNRYQSSELDIKNPSNFYSLTKMHGEECIIKKCSNYLIIRAAWMIGKTNGNNKKFAEKISQQILNNVPEVKVVSNLYGSLTSGDRLADFIIKQINIESEDIIHCASSTVCSRFDIAKHVKNYFKSQTNVIPVNACEFPLSAPRGFSEGLTSEIAQQKFGYKALSWEEELNIFLGSINE